jgi:hypothetical protein
MTSRFNLLQVMTAGRPAFDQARPGFDKGRRLDYPFVPPGGRKIDQMQRVRIGLTGLGFVFLAVLLAAVFTSQSQNEAPITPNLIEQQRAGVPDAAPPAPPAQSAEPLAELGVAPGNVDSNGAAATRPPPAPRPAGAR